MRATPKSNDAFHLFAELGLAAKPHPDKLVFELLASGFASNCYDGQFYCDIDHLVLDATGAPVAVSNFGGGVAAAGYLLDTSRAVKPIIWQVREDDEFQTVDRPNDPHVFINDSCLYGVRARVNAGLGFWQFAYGSKHPPECGKLCSGAGGISNP